ncbi:MAG: hypothetical protein NTY34_00690 [Candidatus Omnitrophica bacterium]|nr:hypothetical protein [Candidatus Omnitrophota bacterium]
MAASLYHVSISSAEDRGGDSIFKYKKELSITDQQEKNLRGILSKIQSYMTENAEKLGGLRAELNKLIADKANPNVIKIKLQTIARMQADATYEDIASVRAIEKELTAEQMSRWRSMQEEYKKGLQQAVPDKAADTKKADRFKLLMQEFDEYFAADTKKAGRYEELMQELDEYSAQR